MHYDSSVIFGAKARGSDSEMTNAEIILALLYHIEGVYPAAMESPFMYSNYTFVSRVIPCLLNETIILYLDLEFQGG